MATEMLLAFVVSLSLLLPSARGGVICEELPQERKTILFSGGVICEELPQELCAYAVSSSYKRCVLESFQRGNGMMEYQCRTSEAVVDGFADHVETDECVHSCGVERSTVGISSDMLLEPQFAVRLCSPECYQNCPNIVDLYFNLAAGEGVFLPDLCAARRENPHRAILELLSSGAALGPATSGETSRPEDASDVDAPAPATNGESENYVATAPAPMAADDQEMSEIDDYSPAPGPVSFF